MQRWLDLPDISVAMSGDMINDIKTLKKGKDILPSTRPPVITGGPKRTKPPPKKPTKPPSQKHTQPRRQTRQPRTRSPLLPTTQAQPTTR